MDTLSPGTGKIERGGRGANRNNKNYDHEADNDEAALSPSSGRALQARGPHSHPSYGGVIKRDHPNILDELGDHYLTPNMEWIIGPIFGNLSARQQEK